VASNDKNNGTVHLHLCVYSKHMSKLWRKAIRKTSIDENGGFVGAL